jgi:para-aminobenzoate synthetase component 1
MPGTSAGTTTLPDQWLVIDSPSGDPFGALEQFLAGHGFGVWSEPFVPAADGLVADLYLGYRLAAALPGVSGETPPEPCRLPALACRVRSAEGERRAVAGGFRVGPFRQTWTTAQHRQAVSEVRRAIARGDVYQTNVVQHMSAEFEGDPRGVEAALAPLNAEHAAALHAPSWSIISATPELFLRRRGEVVETMPIKGTRPAGDPERIADNPKDRAEHVMIVDLERNDLARICVPHSVHVPDFLIERPMAGVRHLVSRVQGRLALGLGLADMLRATFPGGSVTGAPKVSAVNHIARLEPVGRGASMGALGRVYPNGDLDLGLTIRTFAIADDRIHLWVGGGIVWDSDPAEEVEESLVKARPLLALLGSRDE